jgi:predicted transcriptional regulator
LSDFERGQIVGARLTETSLAKTAILLGVSRATVSKVMSAAYTNHGKKISAVKINIGRKRSSLFRKITQLPAAQVTAELNIHLEHRVFTKIVRCESHKSNTHCTTAIAKPLITEINSQMRKR